jgi:3-dehydroquinate synthase
MIARYTMRHTFTLPGYSVGVGQLAEIFPEWLAQQRYSQVFLLTDANTDRYCRADFLNKTGLPASTPMLSIPAGELHKTLTTCSTIWSAMFAARLDRRALVINLGGGVLGDMGGFCAATYKRGVDFVQIPTTLLSMTDAAIGGKLGVDFQGLKNAVGVFQNPAAVFVDPDFLRTLPDRELRSGFAEVLKHALIGAPALWQTIRAMADLSAVDWFEVLRDSIAVKVRVVTEDPLEKGLRAVLNLGHTIGHAVESYRMEGPDPLTHGEAIAMGMISESYLAYGAGRRLDETVETIRRFFSHEPVPESAFDALWTLMQNDKKNTGGGVRIGVPDEGPFTLLNREITRDEAAQSIVFYNQLGY